MLAQGLLSDSTATMRGGRGLLIQGVHASVEATVERLFGYRVAVKPGEETVIDLTVSTLPRNADVKTCRAALLAGGPSPITIAAQSSEPATTGVAITGPDNVRKPYEVEVSAPARPRNVTLRLEGGDVFFRFGDLLTNGRYELPDFAPQLNAYLDQYKGGVPVRLRFLLTSDSEGSADVEMGDVTFARIQTQTWTNQADGTTSVDRNFELDYGDVRDVELLPLPSDGSERRLVAVSIDATGEFGPERSLGDASLAFVGPEFATIDADFGAAQALRPEIDAQVVSLALVLHATKPASVYAALYGDAAGRPDMARPALGETQLTLATSDGAQWSYADLSGPVALRAGELVWMVCRGIQGDAQLAVSRGSLTLLDQLRVSRGGRIWRTLSHNEREPAKALVRLIYAPGPENGISATTLVFRSAASGTTYASVPLEPTAQPTTLRVPLTGVQANEVVRAEVHSAARGTLTLASLFQEYQ